MDSLKRGVSASLLAALSGPTLYPVVLVYLDWPGGAVRVHSNRGTLVFDGYDWRGVGEFGQIALPGEEKGTASDPAQLRLLGAPDEMDAYLAAPIRNRPGAVYFGLVTERNGTVLVAPPMSIYEGYMDSMWDVVLAENGMFRRDIVIELVGGPAQRSYTELFHTYEDQIGLHPTDTAGRLVQFSEAYRDKLTWPE